MNKLEKLNFGMITNDGSKSFGTFEIEEYNSISGMINCCQKVTQYSPVELVFNKRYKHNSDFMLSHILEPLVSSRLALFLDEIFGEQIQVLDTSYKDYKLLNVLNMMDCFDYEKSKYSSVFEDRKVGIVTDLHILLDKCNGLDIFRIKNWPMPIVISDKALEKLEKSNFKLNLLRNISVT